MGAGSVHDATAENETRTLSFHHTHSGEDLTVTFKRNGRYDEDALKQLNHYLRDWRSQDQTEMDRHLFDIIWEVYRDVDGKEPIQIVSAYRCPSTNSMLRHRSAHSGVARFSQHMLGHAMDLSIPGVPLEQIRFAGLRLQRGGVGFYPTSGSPFVHLDTGNIRHWPRMTHDQLVKVFPDERTVHIPSDGTPLKGYELAKTEIEKRGNGDDGATFSKPGGLLASLFGRKSNDDEDEAAASAGDDEPVTTAVAAKPADSKPVAPVPTPRAKPAAPPALQLASADAQIVQAKPKPQAGQLMAEKPTDATSPTPADIINSRFSWGNDPGTPNQATPAQVLAAITARQATESADPKATASLYQAMAYAPLANSPVDHANIVAASAPIPRSARPATTRLAAANEINTVAAKGVQGDGVATSTRLSSPKGNDVWLRIELLAPSATTSMSVTMLGDSDLTVMRAFFVKPQASIVMGFADDPMMGLSVDHFSGSATPKLETVTFKLRAAMR
ncbi:DUF882 domain-containing protein [Bradyrhizobium sp.]|uniref:DUF882 domain-containing protein n=1 Tax=Bradyrhizobium sp. TaxID=376 RepID=UPI0025BBAFD3|nr:DUF882 domain-containing protein [Bradyrhizobium sp.]